MPVSRKPARKAPKDPYRMRPCRLCKAQFKPTTRVISCANTQEFCCPNHRKEYWKYGGLPFDKLMKRITSEIESALDRRFSEMCEAFQPATRIHEIAQEEIAAVIVRLQLDPNFLRLKTEPSLFVPPSDRQSV